MLPSPSFLLLLLAAPALLTSATSQELQVRGQRSQRDTNQDAIKVVISEGCSNQGDSSDVAQGGKEIDLVPGSPLVLTHKIKLVPSGFGSAGSGSCGCEAEFAVLRERLERLEREVSTLREKCGGAEGGCCTSKESKGAGCSIKPDVTECPNECSDQGRCVDGKCVCFSGFSGPDCSESNCPGNCNDRGRCVNGQCVCDPGFTGPSCSGESCPDNCNSRGRCVNGQCVCDPGFTGTDCSKKTCPSNCSDRGRCVNGKCVCDSGFTGADCSAKSCPGNCNNRGRCVNGQCVCNPGYAAPDCSQRACPDNCNDRGRCVNGKCVCDDGFAGADCSEITCPLNCNDRGRCVNGRCVCEHGFSGDDCSESRCANDCSARGMCVNGQCVCDEGFAGPDCSENTCPENCNDRGRCVNGRCVCHDGFTGDDCSEQACPNGCSDRGKCVNGKCVCDVGSAGPDCSARGCPNNCNKGRCVKGRCICRRGFTGPDCSRCVDGMTGPNCDTVMSGVSQLKTQDVTQTSVTLLWTPPPLQYDTYYITFSSQKESDQQISVQVEGSVTTFTQTGLASGQEYTVTVTGETDGRKGAESTAEFMTLISGPTNLKVVKTTSTSAVVQWEKSQGEIDRYRLTISPSDGAAGTQEMTVPSGQDSAHLRELEAGRSYDVVLVAEKGSSRSEPATTQVVPGETLLRVTPSSLIPAPGQNVGHRKPNPSLKAQDSQDPQKRKEDEGESDSRRAGGIVEPTRDSSSSVTGRTKPLVSRTVVKNGTRPKLPERFTLYGKPKDRGPLRFNATRFVPGERKSGPGPLKKPHVLEKKKAPVVPKKPKPGSPKIGNRTISLTVIQMGSEASRAEGSDDKTPVIKSGTDSDTNRQSSSEEPKEQPDVGTAVRGTDTTPVSSEPSGTAHRQDKKCLNKIKVTHIRLPHRDQASGCRGDGTVLEGNADAGAELKPSSAEAELDYAPDPFHKLVTDTFDGLNITTFSVHLAKPSTIEEDADRVSRRILEGLKPLSPSSSSSSSSSSSPSSSSESASQSSNAPSSSSSSSVASSEVTSTGAPSSSSPSSASVSSSDSDKSDSVGSNKLDVDNVDNVDNIDKGDEDDKGVSVSITAASTVAKKHPSSGERGLTPPKRVFVRRPHPNFGLLRNKTLHPPRPPHRSPPHQSVVSTEETETRRTSESTPSSASDESSSVEVNAAVAEVNGDKDGATSPPNTEVEENQYTMQTERRRVPVRRPPPKGGYVRRPFPNMGTLQNRTRPNLRLLTHPARPLSPETKREQMSPTESPTASSPVSRDSAPAEEAESVEEPEGGVGVKISSSSSDELNQTLRERATTSPQRPTTKVNYFRRPLHGGSFQNKTRLNLRPPHHPYRGVVRKPYPNRKLNGGSSVTVGSQTNQPVQESSPEITEQVPRPVLQTGVQISQTEEQGPAEVTPRVHTDRDVTTFRPLIGQLEKEDDVSVQTTKSGEEDTKKPDSHFDSDVQTQSLDADKITVPTTGGRPTSSGSKASRPVTLPKRQLSTGSTGQQHTQMRHYISGSQTGRAPKTSQTIKRMFDSKTGPLSSSESKPGPDVSSSGVTREPLGYVGLTNRTSDGVTLVWDSPDRKYTNFVVTRKQVVKDQRPKKQEEEVKHQPREEPESEKKRAEDENKVPENLDSHAPTKQTIPTIKPTTGSDTTFKKVLPGSARSLHFEDLVPGFDYTVTLLGKGPGLLSKLHKLVISTGPEPPRDIAFSKVTENSVTVSWTKPKSQVSGFKVSYMHGGNEEPVSVSLASEESTVNLSQLSPGSTYEVSVISLLGLDESDPIKDAVTTLPDPPTLLRAVNVTDTKALLLWRPALAAIDKYAIVYGAGSGSEVRITVSGNAAEQQLSDLEASTTYTVTITSQLGPQESPAATTSFTTAGRDRDGLRDLQATDVTPRTASLSWKPPSKPFDSYTLIYQTEGQDVKEVKVDASATEFNLTRLYPGSKYTVTLQAEGGRYTSTLSTEFTTGTLRFPFPSDCSQELLNGIRTSGETEIFPQGRRGTPMMVYCDMETDGGGWTVFQRRKDGSVDFFRAWRDYIRGFGDLSGEFWLGLDRLHNLTAMTRMSLRVDLRDASESVFARYSTFEVAKRNYRLTVGGYSGTAGDSLSYHNNRVFSTKDRDLTPFITRCAMSYRGGWWYKNCHEANLNGLYGIDVKHQGIIWTTWRGKEFSIPFTEMKMRPASFSPPGH